MLKFEIVEHEAKVSKEMATKLVKLGEKVRNLRTHGLEEGVSTRLIDLCWNLNSSGSRTG